MSKIKKLHAYIGGYGGPSYTVDLIENNTIKYKSLAKDDDLLVITEEELDIFIKKLAQLSLITWSKTYNNNAILDGTQWAFSIETDSMQFTSEGSNAYPLENDFYQLITAIQKLIKRDFQ